MARTRRSANSRKTENGKKALQRSQVAQVDVVTDGKKQTEAVAGTSGVVNGGEEVELAKQCIVDEDIGDEEVVVTGCEVDEEESEEENTQDVPERAKNGYYNFKAKLPKSFTVGVMEEEYHALCAVKTAANLAEQKTLGAVAERAMSWLRLAYKKIHGKDLSRQACRVEERQVKETIEAIIEPNTSATTTNGKGKETSKSKRQSSSEGSPERRRQIKATKEKSTEHSEGQSSSEGSKEIRRSKRLAQADKDKVLEPPVKKRKGAAGNIEDLDSLEADDEEDDDSGDSDFSEAESSAVSIEATSEEAAASGWKEKYSQSSQPNERMEWLAAFYQYLQKPFIFGENMSPPEALEKTRNVHKMIQDMDDTSTTIDCLLDREKIWEWANNRIETVMAERTVQKYILSLEKFVRFIYFNCPSELRRKLSTASLLTVRSLTLSCPNWRSSIHKIAMDRRWEKMEEDPEYKYQVWGEALEKRRQAFDENILGLSNRTPMGTQPLRSKWDREDEQLLMTYFTFKPPKEVIRNVCETVEDLKELVQRKGFERCYEKVKSLYRQTRAVLG